MEQRRSGACAPPTAGPSPQPECPQGSISAEMTVLQFSELSAHVQEEVAGGRFPAKDSEKVPELGGCAWRGASPTKGHRAEGTWPGVPLQRTV